MATLLTNWSNYLYELQGAVQSVFPTEHVLLAELSGVGDTSRVGRFTRDMDTNRDVFSGSNFRYPVILAEMQAGGFASESSTWNVPIPQDTTKATGNLTRVLQAFDLGIDVERDALDNSARQVVAALTKEARQAVATIENDSMNGSGAQLADISDSATSLTITVLEVGGGAISPTHTIWNRLYPNRVVDVLTKSSGADPGQGLRRKIASVNRTTGVVTFSTTAQASDGGSGNIVHATTEGLYIPGSWGRACAGLEDIAAITGTFEAIDKAAVPQWQGTDGRAGVTTTAMLSTAMLDTAVNEGRRSGLGKWDFGIGDPRAIDGYKQSLYSQVRYDPQTSTLKSGFKGIVYDGADAPLTIIKEPRHRGNRLKLIDKDSLQLYGDSKGPAFLDDDGSIMRRFNRTFVREVDLLDRVQLAAKRCNTLVFLSNLDVAS